MSAPAPSAIVLLGADGKTYYRAGIRPAKEGEAELAARVWLQQRGPDALARVFPDGSGIFVRRDRRSPSGEIVQQLWRIIPAPDEKIVPSEEQLPFDADAYARENDIADWRLRAISGLQTPLATDGPRRVFLRLTYEERLPDVPAANREETALSNANAATPSTGSTIAPAGATSRATPGSTSATPSTSGGASPATPDPIVTAPSGAAIRAAAEASARATTEVQNASPRAPGAPATTLPAATGEPAATGASPAAPTGAVEPTGAVAPADPATVATPATRDFLGWYDLDTKSFTTIWREKRLLGAEISPGGSYVHALALRPAPGASLQSGQGGDATALLLNDRGLELAAPVLRALRTIGYLYRGWVSDHEILLKKAGQNQTVIYNADSDSVSAPRGLSDAFAAWVSPDTNRPSIASVLALADTPAGTRATETTPAAPATSPSNSASSRMALVFRNPSVDEDVPAPLALETGEALGWPLEQWANATPLSLAEWSADGRSLLLLQGRNERRQWNRVIVIQTAPFAAYPIVVPDGAAITAARFLYEAR
jgi:hypothetical protein